MENTIKQFTKKIYDDYDLGSEASIDVVIYNQKAYITSFLGLKLEECSTKELGSKIAEMVMLKGLSTPNFYGSWLLGRKLDSLERIDDWKDDDIEFDLDLAKFWEMCRVISNDSNWFCNKAVHIHYDEAGGTYAKVLNDKKEFEDYIKEYYQFEEED